MKWPIRALAITGMLTASWIPRIMSGSDIRATPPSRRMSAGTRSSAITAQAPASSATFACSASTTSMITPPWSISARPLLTRIVPMSLTAAMLAGEEGLDCPAERLGLLQVEHVPGLLDHDELRVRDPIRQDLGRSRPADEVVAAGDHERLCLDPAELRSQVELVPVELPERLGVHAR